MPKGKSRSRKFYITLVIIGLLLLISFKKSLLIAATVNGSPISNLELQLRLNKNHRTQVLNQMTNEKILEQEAAKAGIIIHKSDLDKKIKEVEDKYGGAETFSSLLSQQGLTREDFLSQTKIQLIVEKLYMSEASPSAEEIDQFMKDNADIPEASEPAKFKTIAEEQTRQQRLAKIFNEKFQALKQAAKIQIF